MRRCCFILVFYFFCFTAAFSQSKSEWLEYAETAFKNGDYASAAFFYQQILENTNSTKDVSFPYEIKTFTKKLRDVKNKADSTAKKTGSDSSAVHAKDTGTTAGRNITKPIRFPYVVNQLAESYRLSHDYDKAETWYAKALQAPSRQFPNARLWYGEALMKNGKYEQAKKEFSAFMRSDAATPAFYKIAEKDSASCHFALDTTYTKIRTEVKLADSILNAGTSNFAAGYFNSDSVLIFSSARKESKIPLEEDPVAGAFYCDVFTISKSGTWSTPKNMQAPVNSEKHEGAAVVSEDGTSLFFTQKGDDNLYAIYRSKFLNSQWLQPMKLNENVNLPGYSSMHPSLSADGTVLYFSSNRPGGKGKMDLWYCKIDEFGKASVPVNMGRKLNSTEDEVSPFYHPTNRTIYFSSDGHKGYGGLDIFKAYGSDTTWSSPKNLRPPTNSSKDDLYYVLHKNQRHGYFTSDRKNCKECGGSGYCYQIYSLDKEPNVFHVKGKVYDAETNALIPNSLVTIRDALQDLEPIYVTTDETGSYSALIYEEIDFFIKAQKKKYFADAATISTKGLSESRDFEQDFYLSPIPVGDIVIPGIEYDYDKATLRPESKKVLDELVEFLKLNDNIIIEINSHTDTRGSDVYNLNLSQARAKSVVDYLTSGGIDGARLVAKGYGETKPLISDEDINDIHKKEEKEIAHQRNRRTAFKTLAEDYKSLDIPRKR